MIVIFTMVLEHELLDFFTDDELIVIFYGLILQTVRLLRC